ncbi:hypothetical protein [Hymenobacter terricola]|uniref:hypothetical protein n=1 Tax=Hymenobacter terricola TaxID=2819236 RepID=UPI001B3050B5|nr:hypothetical protein [Hymenobacter terricola]
MSSNLGIALAALLLAVVFPVGLSIAEHLRSSRMAQPVASFRYVIWRDFDLLWTLFQTAYGMALIAAAGAAANHFGLQLISFLTAIPLLLWAWRQFPGIRLYWTYWQHDGRARFAVQRNQKTARYTNREISLTFTLSEVEHMVLHEPPSGRAASNAHSYTCLVLADHRTLCITSLLCDSIDLRALLPAVTVEIIQQGFAWLPDDSNSKKLFGPYGK